MSHHRKSAYLHKQEEWKALYEAGESFRSIAKMEGIYYRTVQGVLRGVVEPRPKKAYAHLADQWVEDYVIKEMNAQEIAEAYKVDGVTVAKYLREAGVEIRNSKTRKSEFEEVIPDWVKQYESGKTLLEIAEKYSTYPQTVHKHIHKKVTMRHYAETSQIHDIAHPDYFERIDSPEKAYWLGVWFGTGYITTSPESRECTLIAGIDQQKTIERFKEVIGYTRDIRVVKKRKAQVARLRINNKQFATSLEKLGLVPNKTEDMVFPEQVEEAFYAPFLLGYSEGKGSSYIHTQEVAGRTYYQLWLYIYGGHSFLQTTKKAIKTGADADVDLKEVKKRGIDGGIRYELRASRFTDVEKIIEWLYKDAPVYSEERDMRTKLEIKRHHMNEMHKKRQG